MKPKDFSLVCGGLAVLALGISAASFGINPTSFDWNSLMPKSNPPPKSKMQKSITVINTGNTYRCRAPGAKLRNYFDQLVAQGWTVTSSETNNFYGDYGNSRGPCSITYYVLEK
jgi:hypothetical protein